MEDRLLNAIVKFAAKATGTPDRTISGSYDWLRLGGVRSIGNVCYDLQQL